MDSASFSIADVSKLREQSGEAWHEFFAVPTLSIGVYHVPAGTEDSQTHDPHDRDEVYVGICGHGWLQVGGEEFEIKPEAIVYVKQGVEHHFHDVTDDLNLLVLFAGDGR